MSRWTDRFGSHTSITLLDQLVTHSKALSEQEIEDQNIALEVARLVKGISYLKNVLGSVDPDLVSLGALNELQNHLQNTVNEVNNFISSKDLGHITNANNQFDNILASASKSLVIAQNRDKDTVEEVLAAYNKQIEKFLSTIQKQTAAILDEANERLASASQKAEEEITVITAKSELFAKDVSELRISLDKIKSEASTQFTEFKTQFSALMKAEEDKSTKQLQTAAEKIDSSFAKFVAKSNAASEIMEKLKEDSEIVFGVVQNTAQAGAHKNYADQEMKSANRYRSLAIILMISAMAFVLWPALSQALDFEVPSMSLDDLWKRGLTSLIIFAPAFYLARESGKHRNNEVRNRRTELTLRTIDPYLSLMSNEEEKEKLKAKVAASIFSEKGTEGDRVDDNDAVSLAEKIVSIISKTAGKNSPTA